MDDWLDEQEFYEHCQQYRHAREVPALPGMLNVVEAFEALKEYIRRQVEEEVADSHMWDDERDW